MSGPRKAGFDPWIPCSRGRRLTTNRLVGRVVKASASRAEDPRFESRQRRGVFFSGSSHTSDLQNGTPVATLPGVIAVSAGTGWPGVSIL